MGLKGWGSAPCLLGFGILLGIGCGGRTSALEDDYIFGTAGDGAGHDGGALPVGGSRAVGGRPSRGGTSGVAGHSGSYPVGGAYVGGTGPYPVGGAGPYPTGGTGPYPTGGTGPIPIGGYYPVAGTGFGGYPSGGAFPMGGFYSGGYGAAPPLDCRSCVTQACAPQLIQCFQDFGCLSIFGCMQSTGCEAFQCYTDQACRGVIDQWGGPNGQAMNELLKTFSCAFQAGCPCN